MAPNFSKEAILSGIVDYYCLVCESHMQCEKDINEHIAKSTHKKHLEKTCYEIEEESIKKIKQWYFCEFCNYVIKLKAKIRLHIAEKSHIKAKIEQGFVRSDDSVMAFGDVIIDKNSWNGLCGGMCVLCNAEYSEEQHHLNDVMHNINLIQKNIEMDKHKNIYRLIDETSFQCMTCNTLESLASLNSHLLQANHKKLFEKCRKHNKMLCTKDDNIKNDVINLEAKQEIKNDTLKKDNPPVGSNNQTEIKNNKDYTIQEHEEVICKILKANKYIAKGENGNELFCILCSMRLIGTDPAYHVNSTHHQNILKLHKSRLDKLNVKYTEKKNQEAEIANKCKENKKSNVDDASDISKILESLADIQKNNIEINFETNRAFCKKCSVNIDYNFKAIQEHINEHKTINKDDKIKKESVKLLPVEPDVKQDVGKSPTQRNVKNTTLHSTPVQPKQPKTVQQGENVENYATANGLICKPSEKIVFCQKCKVEISFSLKSMKAHVNGSTHKLREVLQRKANEKNKVKSVSMKMFVKTVSVIDIMMGHCDIIINNEFCIDFLSFLFMNICKITNIIMLRCELCQASLNEPIHYLNHIQVYDNASVVTNMNTEFIRIIKEPNTQDKYHCGYCNKFFESWDNLQDHLKTTAHTENKNFAMWRLESYKSKLGEINVSEHIFRSESLLNQMFNGSFFN